MGPRTVRVRRPRSGMSALPPPTPAAAAHSARLVDAIRAEIDAAGGWIPFSRYMDLALYAPGLGYYTAGARKLGAEGDFTTAPELTPLFGHAIAQQLGALVAEGLEDVLEIGPGTGMLAAAILEELERLGRLPRTYQLLEVSADLRERERDLIARRVPHLLDRVMWLNRLPPAFEGIVLGNEVLDAMPVEIVRVTDEGILQGGVAWDTAAQRLHRADRPASGALLTRAQSLGLAPPYETEIGLVAEAFVRTLGEMLTRGVMLFVDYGFPAHEFRHPQRAHGTLMCHYRHHAHDDPFLHPGLQDITAHVDFSAVTAAARDAGLDLLGYTSQAHFLLACGLTDVLARTPPEETGRYLPAANAAQRLVSPAEMGELFKAIAFGRWPAPLDAFRSGDRSGALDAPE